jgi:hypothetical protein
VFKDLTGVGSLATLRLFPTPAELRELQPQDLVLERIPFAKSMLEVKGISKISLGGILGEAGDLSGFVEWLEVVKLTFRIKRCYYNKPHNQSIPSPSRTIPTHPLLLIFRIKSCE